MQTFWHGPYISVADDFQVRGVGFYVSSFLPGVPLLRVVLMNIRIYIYIYIYIFLWRHPAPILLSAESKMGEIALRKNETESVM